MEHIKNLISKRIKQSGFSQQVKTSLVIDDFSRFIEQIFGSKISKKIRPLYVKNKILTVACLSSTVAQELNFKKPALIEQINQKAGEKLLSDLKIVV